MAKSRKETSLPPCIPLHKELFEVVDEIGNAYIEQIDRIDLIGNTIVDGFHVGQKPKLLKYDSPFISDFSVLPVLENQVISELQPYQPEGYQEHINPDTRETIPQCCNYHKEVFEEANQWFNVFPECCEHHKKLVEQSIFTKSRYTNTPDKIITQLSYTEFIISENIDKPYWHEIIGGYIDHSFLCFGVFGVGSNIYLKNLRNYIVSNDLISKSKAEKLVAHIDYVARYYMYSVVGIQNHPQIKQWLDTFPFDLTFAKELKKKFLLPEMPIPFDTKTNQFRYEATPFNLKNKNINEILYKITKDLLAHLNISVQYKEGALVPDKAVVDLKLKKFDNKYQSSPSGEDLNNHPDYSYILNEWYQDMIDLVKDLPTLVAETPVTPEADNAITENNTEAETSDTRQIIEEKFSEIGAKGLFGWEYAFRRKSDFDSFVDLLEWFFTQEEYELPSDTIMLRPGSKTHVATALGLIHGELGEKLSSDKEFFEIVSVLNHFKDESQASLYKALTRHRI